jgi:hypothetical protein
LVIDDYFGWEINRNVLKIERRGVYPAPFYAEFPGLFHSLSPRVRSLRSGNYRERALELEI